MGHVACMGEKRDTYGKLQMILWNPDFIGIQNCKPAALSVM
jgi:hypothetical protein